MSRECKVTRQQFRSDAQPVQVILNGVPLQAFPKEFKTGSLGWFVNGKMSVTVGGVPVTVQVGVNLTIVGSKEVI